MTTTTFLMLLSSFSVLSGLVTEGIKKLISDKANMSYNVIALVVALVIGGVGSAVYYQLNAIPFNLDNIIYLVLMGLASGLCSMDGFDKIKHPIEQITSKKAKL